MQDHGRSDSRINVQRSLDQIGAVRHGVEEAGGEVCNWSPLGMLVVSFAAIADSILCSGCSSALHIQSV